ncbi:MAG TPA: hypothetical protein VLI93_03650 [Acetobacteraceae bacterium]|nr:hypothetical protein [Acetobacteraceae bacterium]
MPVVEQRSVEFDGDEILRALAAAPRVAEALGLRPGQVGWVDFQPDERAVVFRSNADPEKRVTVAAEALAALLVAYCARISVPLPRKGQKQLEVGSAGVTLRIVVEQAPGGGKLGLQQDYPSAVMWPRRQHSIRG